MRGKRGLVDRLRDRVVSALHVGHLRAGDRLPSIREVAAETGEDPRAVSRAYRALEVEGLVEVRDRSGVYAAPQARVGGGVLQETAEWAAHVLVEGWRRGIGVAEVAGFLQRCTTARAVRCAFVESSEDVIAAFAHDLREHLGVAVETVWLHSLPRGEPGAGGVDGSVPAALRAADLIVTTAFHARDVGPLAAALGTPLIAATVNADLVAAVERQLRSGALTVVCADPAFGRRMSLQYQELVAAGARLRVVLADDARGVAALDPAQLALVTRAARRRLGTVDLPLVFPHSPTISARSALEVVELLVRANLQGPAV